MTALEQAIERLDGLDPQVRTEVIPGVFLRRRENGGTVLTIHYSADPDRNPQTEEGALWFEQAKSDYSSDSAWQREQEIDALAGGGERVFAKALKTFAHKTIISDPNWTPDPRWDVVLGFDHGSTNATALVKAYIDFHGNIYMAGEYYSFKREGWDNEVWQNAPELLKMPDLHRARWCMADPSIFVEGQVTPEGKKSSIVAAYRQNGVKFLQEYGGERSDITFVERVLSNHWKDLANRVPTLFIVCRNPSDRLQPGLHPYDCPNLLWELLRTRRAQLTATQMTAKNPTEKIVDKQNHARDACLVGGTLIATERGQVAIEDVLVGDRVWTRRGWCRVERAWMTDPAASVLRVRFSNGLEIAGTGEHPVWIKDLGWVRLDALKYGMMATCLSMGIPKSGSGWGSTSTDIQAAQTGGCGSTSATEASISIPSRGYSTIKGRSLRNITFTTSTATLRTMNQRTSRLSPCLSISPTLASPARRMKKNTLRQCGLKRLSGTSRQRAARGTVSTAGSRYTRYEIRRALNAALDSRTRIGAKVIASARLNAVPAGAIPTGSTMRRGNVSTAARSFPAPDSTGLVSVGEFAAASVVEVSPIVGQQPVYDLTVEDAHEFFANGILVHNCKYLYFSVKRAAEVPVGEQIQKVVEGLNPTSAQLAAQRWWADHMKRKSRTVSMRTKGRMR